MISLGISSKAWLSMAFFRPVADLFTIWTLGGSAWSAKVQTKFLKLTLFIWAAKKSKHSSEVIMFFSFLLWISFLFNFCWSLFLFFFPFVPCGFAFADILSSFSFNPWILPLFFRLPFSCFTFSGTFCSFSFDSCNFLLLFSFRLGFFTFSGIFGSCLYKLCGEVQVELIFSALIHSHPFRQPSQKHAYSLALMPLSTTSTWCIFWVFWSGIRSGNSGFSMSST